MRARLRVVFAWGALCALAAVLLPTAAATAADEEVVAPIEFTLISGTAKGLDVTATPQGMVSSATGRPAASIMPGEYIFVKYQLRNTTAEPLKVTDVPGRLWTRIRDELIGEYPENYCDQYLSSSPRVPGNPHVNLPDFSDFVLGAGETSAVLEDSQQWMLRGGAGNVCQQLKFYWGAEPVFEPLPGPAPTPVAPVQPVWAPAVCEGDTLIEGTVALPAVAGLSYLLDGEPVAPGTHIVAGSGEPPGQLVAVVAEADDGFVISEGAESRWEHGFPAVTCAGTTPPPAPDGESAGDPKPQDAIANTGRQALGLAALGGLAAMLAGVGLAAVALTRQRRA